jgi:hypothetical protein
MENGKWRMDEKWMRQMMGQSVAKRLLVEA